MVKRSAVDSLSYHRAHRLACATLLIQSLLASMPLHTAGDDSTSRLKASAAVRVVNPTSPAVTIGHRVMERFSNVYADLRVQAMVIEDRDGQQLAWLGMDFAVVRHEVVDQIKQQIQTAHGIDPQYVCINASHTHSAPPLTVEEAVLEDHVDADYSRRVLDEAVAVVGDAIARLEPANVRYAFDKCNVGINRRLMQDGKLQFLPNPAGIVDHRVQIVAAESQATNKLIGVVVKYACHPVTVVGLGLGSDYPGYMRKITERRHAGAVAVFLQGCGADVRIRAVNDEMNDWTTGDFAMAERFGREVSDAVDRALDKDPPDAVAVEGPLSAAYEEIRLPVEPLAPAAYQEAAQKNDPFSGLWGRRFTELLEQGKPIPTSVAYRIQAFHLGAGDSRLTVVALDGEVFTEYGLRLETALASGPMIVLGYSNGVVTYIPTASAMAEGGYETTAFRYFLVPGPFPPTIEQQILKASVRVSRSGLGGP